MPMTLVLQIPPLYVLGILVAGLLLVLYRDASTKPARASDAEVLIYQPRLFP